MSTSSSKSAVSVATLIEFSKVDRTKVGSNHVVVRLSGHQTGERKERKPLHLVACIDLSGSMDGSKIEQLRNSLQALVRNLTDSDTLGIVAFSNNAWVIAPNTKCDSSGKKVLEDRIVGIRAYSATNLSGGITDAIEMLKGLDAEKNASIDRVLLMTDGMPTAGLTNNDQLLTFVKTYCPEGISVSSFGYGSDDGKGKTDEYAGFDPVLLSQIADICRGNYYHVSGPEKVAEILGAELGGLISVAAQSIRVKLTLKDNVAVEEVLNDLDVETDKDTTIIRVNDIYDEEIKPIVVKLRVPEMSKSVSGPRPKKCIGTLIVTWVDTATGQEGRHEEKIFLEFVKPEDAQKEPDPQVQKEVAIMNVAKAQVAAVTAAKAGKHADAQSIIRGADVVLRSCKLFDEDKEMQLIGKTMAVGGAIDAMNFSEARYNSGMEYEVKGLSRSLMNKRDSGRATSGMYRTSVVASNSNAMTASAMEIAEEKIEALPLVAPPVADPQFEIPQITLVNQSPTSPSPKTKTKEPYSKSASKR